MQARIEPSNATPSLRATLSEGWASACVGTASIDQRPLDGATLR